MGYDCWYGQSRLIGTFLNPESRQWAALLKLTLSTPSPSLSPTRDLAPRITSFLHVPWKVPWTTAMFGTPKIPRHLRLPTTTCETSWPWWGRWPPWRAFCTWRLEQLPLLASVSWIFINGKTRWKKKMKKTQIFGVFRNQTFCNDMGRREDLGIPMFDKVWPHYFSGNMWSS